MFQFPSKDKAIAFTKDVDKMRGVTWAIARDTITIKEYPNGRTKTNRRSRA
jgi:hypothetical protein